MLLLGPGAGKTTACLEIVSQLKMRGKSAEYVPEYAKELVWDERTQLLDGSLMNQLTILCEQYKRIKRLFHKVDYIVTDSPLWLNLLYYRYSSYKQRNVYMDLLQDIEILKINIIGISLSKETCQVLSKMVEFKI